MILRPLLPSFGQGQNISTTTTSASTPIRADDDTVRIVNRDTTNGVYIKLYASVGGTITLTASAVDFFIPAGVAATISKGLDQDRIAAVAVAGTPSLNVITGKGF